MSKKRNLIKEIDEAKFEIIMQYKASIESGKIKSQDDFEKSIYLLASGGLVISLLALDKILDKIEIIEFKFFFIFGLFCFVITLLSNLISHNKSIKESEKLINKINENPECIFEDEFTKTLNNGNAKIEFLNKTSIAATVLGASSVLIFLTINFINMSDKNPHPKPTQTKKESPTIIEKGRTIVSPPKVVKPKND
ncbi:hypothetical protein [Kaistella polysaccharea]|uniref:hypothetical protein n=1 Tax=Kaistella polysaccharea TaxID=2878534 RepID=UPI001CF56DFA|nr:hypothetical protein [Kaistella polysaccharea]